MTKIQLLKRFVIYLFLATGLLIPGRSTAQSAITINGPTTACVGDIPTYTFSPVIAGVGYTWSVTSQGAIQTPGASAGLVQWISAGNATITVTGKNASGQTVAQGTLPVSVSTAPNPVITASAEVDCMPLDTTGGDKPPIRDTSTCKKVCAHSTVTYTVPNISGATYIWSVNGDFLHSASGNQCDVTWGSAGYGNVSVTVTHGSCSGSASMCIQIIEGPQAHFITMPNTPTPEEISVCLNSTVIFIDQSSSPVGSPIVSWLWDFGDGTYSSAGVGTQNGPVEHTYTEPGSYKATLTVTNACGCSSRFSITVDVSEVPGVKIECPRVSCEREEIHYFIEKPECDDGKWEVIGGHILSQNPQEAVVIWDQVDPSGFGYLSYTTDCGECPGTTTIKVPVIQQHGFIHGPTSVCPEKQYEYTLPQWPTTKFTWSITGNGTLEGTDQPNKVVVLSGASGSYTLSVDYCNTLINCSGSAQLTANVMPPANISGPSVVCINDSKTYTLVGTSTATWTLTDPYGIQTTYNNVASISPTFTFPGSYTLEISGNFCAPEPMKIKVDEKPATPTSIIGPDKTCIGVPVQYTAQAPIAGTVFEWQNMNGSVNAAAGTSTYATFTSLSGTLKVFRVTTDAAQCRSDALVKVVQSDMPSSISVNYSIPTAPQVCGSTQWPFSASYANGDLYDWKIIPADAASVVSGNATPNVQVLFNNPLTQGQTVGVALAITKCGQVKYDTAWFQVNSIPNYTATASPTPVCSGDPVSFTLSPTLVSGSSVTWDFGDGSTSSSGTHAYTNNGSSQLVYHPSVTITSNCGVSKTVQTNTVTVNPAPLAHITPGALTACNSVSATLTATVTGGPAGSNNFAWFGNTPNPPNPPAPNCSTCTQWAINQFGDYSVTVTSSVNGCSTTSNIVHVTEVCPDPPCTGSYPQLVSSSPGYVSCGRVKATISYISNGCAINSQHWVLPPEAINPNPSTGATAVAEASFAAAGYYTFVYVVNYTNPQGQTCNVAFPQIVFVPFVGDMLYDIACGSGNNYVVTMFDHTNYYPGENINHSYSYRLNGSPSWTTIPGTGTSVSQNLPPGTYQIREVVNSSTTPAAPSCTMTETIVLPAKPVANFSYSWDTQFDLPCERDVPVHFSGLPNGLEYLWDFDDPYTNSQQNPGKLFNTDGNKPVTLTVTDPATGCVSSKVQSVQVAPDPYWDGNHRPYITTNPTPPACEGTVVSLGYHKPTIPGSGLSFPPTYQWYLNNNPISGFTSGTYGATVDGGYRVIGTDGNGCRVPSEFLPINFKHVPPAVISGRTDYCALEPFTLNGFAGNVPGLTYEWRRNPGNILVGTGSSIEQNLGSGTVSYTLTLSLNGCHNVSQPYTVTIHNNPPNPVPAFNIVNCNPYTVELTATNSQSGTYNWSNGASGSPAYAYAGGPYQVVFTNQYGCRSKDSIHVPRSPEEYLWIFPTGCFCQSLFEGTRCGRDKPYITGPIISFVKWSYLYNGVANLSGVGYVPPYNNFYNDGTYNLWLYNGYCDATSGDMYVGGDYCKMIGQRPTGLSIDNLSRPMLQLVPNPAQSDVLVNYRLVGSSQQQSLELYDQLGRKLKSIKLEALKGSLKLPLGDYAAGTYQVLLKQDGRIIEQSKLSVTH